MERGLIGRQTPPTMYVVERGAIRRYADAIGDTNPIYHEEAAANAAGFPSLCAPPTFPTAIPAAFSLKAALQLPERRMLVSEESIDAYRPIVAGDRLVVKARVADIQERAAPTPVDVVVLETEGHDEAGAPVFRHRQTLIVRRGRE